MTTEKAEIVEYDLDDSRVVIYLEGTGPQRRDYIGTCCEEGIVDLVDNLILKRGQIVTVEGPEGNTKTVIRDFTFDCNYDLDGVVQMLRRISTEGELLGRDSSDVRHTKLTKRWSKIAEGLKSTDREE